MYWAVYLYSLAACEQREQADSLYDRWPIIQTTGNRVCCRLLLTLPIALRLYGFTCSTE